MSLAVAAEGIEVGAVGKEGNVGGAGGVKVPTVGAGPGKIGSGG